MLSPLRPIPRNGNLYVKLLGNAFTGECILQRPTPRHPLETARPRVRYPISQQLPWCPSRGHTSKMASPTKNLIVIVAANVKKIQTKKSMAPCLSVSKSSPPSGDQKRFVVVMWWRKVCDESTCDTLSEKPVMETFVLVQLCDEIIVVSKE